MTATPAPGSADASSAGRTPGAGVGIDTSFTELDARRMGRVRRFFARRPRAADLLICLIVLVDGSTTLGFDDDLSPGRLTAGWLLLAGAVGALWFRRRWPVAVLSALAVLAVGNVLATGRLDCYVLAIGFGVYAVAASRPARMTWAAVGGSLLLAGAGLLAVGTTTVDRSSGGPAVTAPGDASGPVEGSTTSADISGLLVISLISLAVGTNVSSRRDHVRSLVARHHQLVEAGEQQAKLAAAAEQTRIAREMHDVVAHGLTVMVALADGARTAMRRSPDEAEQALELVAETGRTALTDMRRMLGVLRGTDTPFEPQPTAEDLDELVQSFRAAGMTVHLTTSGPPLPEDPTLALTVYRVVQESLTNALRHAGPHTRADVLVARTTTTIRIDVTDDGTANLPDDTPMTAPRTGEGLRTRVAGRLSGDPATALPPAPARPGRGLVGMRERAAVYGGSVVAGPHLTGWRVQVTLHIDQERGGTPIR